MREVYMMISTMRVEDLQCGFQSFLSLSTQMRFSLPHLFYQNIKFNAILCYVMLCYVMLCYVMLCYVMLCYVMLCYVMLCYVMSCHVMLCYVMLCYVMLCYVMLCYVMLVYYFILNYNSSNFLYDDIDIWRPEDLQCALQRFLNLLPICVPGY